MCLCSGMMRHVGKGIFSLAARSLRYWRRKLRWISKRLGRLSWALVRQQHGGLKDLLEQNWRALRAGGVHWLVKLDGLMIANLVTVGGETGRSKRE